MGWRSRALLRKRAAGAVDRASGSKRGVGLYATPSISVLFPVRDARETVRDALASVQAQSLDSWELLAVDDGSRDGSGELLDRIAAEDPRIRVIHEAALGIVAALEAGRREARAPILARLDADDRAAPERLEAQLSYLEAHPEIALCGTHVRYFPRSAVRDGARRYEAWLNSLVRSEHLVRDLWVECPLAHPSFAMRATALDRVGGYREAAWPEDYDLVLRLWAAGEGLGIVPRVLLDWREREGRLSRVDPRYSPAAFRRLKLTLLAATLLRGRDGLVVWGAGPTGKAMARDALRMGIAVRAFVDLDPRKLGQEIHGAPVIPPEGLAAYRGALVLVAVGRPGARDEIRADLGRLGWCEGVDFVAVA
jgi:hypothetical protein